MRKPTDNEILLAEQRLVQARREAVASADRLKTAFRNALASPRTLLGVAGVAGLLGYLVFKPAAPRRREAPAPSTAATAATAAAASTSMAGIVMAFTMRYAMQRLPGIGFRLVEEAFRRSDSGRSRQGMPPLQRPAAATVH